jgi:hypothetical protein
MAMNASLPLPQSCCQFKQYIPQYSGRFGIYIGCSGRDAWVETAVRERYDVLMTAQRLCRTVTHKWMSIAADPRQHSHAWCRIP